MQYSKSLLVGETAPGNFQLEFEFFVIMLHIIYVLIHIQLNTLVFRYKSHENIGEGIESEVK